MVYSKSNGSFVILEYGPDEELPEVKCSPHWTVVQVGPRYGAAVTFEPSYVKVKRCIGKALPRTKCVPVKNKYRYRNVKVQKYLGDILVDTCAVPIREDFKCRLVYDHSKR